MRSEAKSAESHGATPNGISVGGRGGCTLTSKARLVSLASLVILTMAGSAYGERKARLGIGGQFLPGSAAVKITGIQENSPASAAGLQESDLVFTLDGQPAAQVWTRDKPAGVPITLEIERDGRRFKVEITPAVPSGSWLQGLVQEYARARYWLKRKTSQHTVGTWSGSGSGTVIPGQYATTTRSGVSGFGSSTTSELESWTLYRGNAPVVGVDFMGLFRDAGVDPMTMLDETQWTAVVRQHCLAQGIGACPCVRQGGGAWIPLVLGGLAGAGALAVGLTGDIYEKNEQGVKELTWPRGGLVFTLGTVGFSGLIAGGVVASKIHVDDACVAERSRNRDTRWAGYQFLAASGRDVGLNMNNAAHRARVEELAARANRRLRDSYGLDLADVAMIENPQKGGE